MRSRHCRPGDGFRFRPLKRVSFNRINKKTGNRLKQQLIDGETGDPVAHARALSVSGEAQTTLGRRAAGLIDLERALALSKNDPTQAALHPRLLRLTVPLLVQTGRPDEAATWRAELAALEAATRPATSASTQQHR